MKIQKVGIVGTGAMGTGIAACAAQHGFEVTIMKWTPGSVAEVRERFASAMAKSASGHTVAMQAIRWTDAGDDLSGCDLVIESIVEDEEAKRGCFRALDARAKPDAIFATNTSTLPIRQLAIARPDRFVGLHFFNPVAKMKLVEVGACEASPETLEAALDFVTRLGKEPAVVPDTPGYVVNRLFMAQALEAIRMLEARGRAEDVRVIDLCPRLGLNHPMGPFELMDFIGLDVVLAMSKHLRKWLDQPHFAPPVALERLVAAKSLGRKAESKLGFYDHSDRENPRVNPELATILRGDPA